MNRSAIVGAVIGLVVSPLPLYLAVNSAGAGHGNYRWSFTFFPLLTFAMLAGLGALVIPLALIQYPFYGWFAGRCISNKQFVTLTVVLLLVHVIPMLLTFL
jgi:hypothetical protein